MKTVVFTFSRMQPPTAGHKLLVSCLVETARAYGADHMVYLSQTHDRLNPLEWSFKHRVCQAAFRGVNISRDVSIKNPYIALEYLKEHYDRVVMVAGSDQAGNYSNFRKYTQAWGIEFEVVTAGQRIAESTGIHGVSATKARQYAALDDIDSFMNILPNTLNENIKLLVYKNVQKGLRKFSK